MTKIILKFALLYFFLIKLTIANQVGHISDLKWKKRIIIIADDESFHFNKRVKKYQKELEEREISIIFFNKSLAYLDNKIISKKFSKSVENKIKNINPYHRLITYRQRWWCKKFLFIRNRIGENIL